MKQKLIGLVLASSLLAGFAVAPITMADTMATGSVTLTAEQQGVIQSLSAVLGGISVQLQQMLAARIQEGPVLAQLSTQLGGVAVQLQQGNPTPDMLTSMSITVNAIAAQVNRIATRRAAEDAVIAQLPGILGQIQVVLAGWLR